MNKNKIVNTMRKLLDKRHSDRGDVFAEEIQNKPGGKYKFDIVAIPKSYRPPKIIIYELKSSREDWKTDRKAHNYMDYCNELYFVVPKDKVLPEELPPGAGLIEFNTKTKKLRQKVKADYREIDWPWQVIFAIIMRMGNEHAQIRELKREVNELKYDLNKLTKEEIPF